MSSRRDVLRKLFKGAALTSTGGLLWGSLAKSVSSSKLVLRPPGALPEKEFVKACIKCGQCVTACPYKTLQLAGASEGITPGTPYFKPENVPCYMCTTFPCTKACPTGALNESLLKDNDNKASINNARMGLAVIHRESCIAYHGIQCDACYRACPLMGKAITLNLEKNTFTGKHANMKPVVNSNMCTGCGMCEHACVTEKAAMFVLPLELATGEIGDHYQLVDRQNFKKKPTNENSTGKKDDDIESALKYLNDGDLLTD